MPSNSRCASFLVWPAAGLTLLLLAGCLPQQDEDLPTETPDPTVAAAFREALDAGDPTAIAAYADAIATEQARPPPRIVRSAQAGSAAEAEGVRVTINQILDPWETSVVAPGRRAIAFDVTIENVKGGTHAVQIFNFKLRDSEDFEYECFGCGGGIAFIISPDPALSSVGLGSGGKTRGWIAFEIVETAAIMLLKYDPVLFTTKDIEFHFD